MSSSKQKEKCNLVNFIRRTANMHFLISLLRIRNYFKRTFFFHLNKSFICSDVLHTYTLYFNIMYIFIMKHIVDINLCYADFIPYTTSLHKFLKLLVECLISYRHVPTLELSALIHKER